MSRLWHWLLVYFGLGDGREEPPLRPVDRALLAAICLVLLAALVLWWGWEALIVGVLAVVAVRLYDRFGRRKPA